MKKNGNKVQVSTGCKTPFFLPPVRPSCPSFSKTVTFHSFSKKKFGRAKVVSVRKGFQYTVPEKTVPQLRFRRKKLSENAKKNQKKNQKSKTKAQSKASKESKKKEEKKEKLEERRKTGVCKHHHCCPTNSGYKINFFLYKYLL